MKTFFTYTLICLTSISHGVYSMTNTQFEQVQNNIQKTFTADVISPSVWKSVVQDIKNVEQRGNLQQQQALNVTLQQNQRSIDTIVDNTLNQTLNSAEVKRLVSSIAMGTLYGVLPAVGFKGLSILAGNMNLATAGSELVDIGILSALDSFVRYGEEQSGTSVEIGALKAGIISTAVQQFLGYQGARPSDLPLLGPMGRPLLVGVQSLAFARISKRLNSMGGASKLLENINWKDVAIGPDEQQAITQHSGAYEFIRDNLGMIMQNQTVRKAIATTVTYAVEGAVTSAVMHTLGLGFYDESLPNALTHSMIRGSLEGLYNFSQYGDQHLGIIQRVQGGFVTQTVQNYMQPETGLGISVVKQITTGAVNSLVRQAGGWKQAFKSLYTTGKKLVW